MSKLAFLNEDTIVLTSLPLLFLILAFVMLERYYYLYFTYYSKFLFRAFVFVNETVLDQNNTKTSVDEVRGDTESQGLPSSDKPKKLEGTSELRSAARPKGKTK